MESALSHIWYLYRQKKFTEAAQESQKLADTPIKEINSYVINGTQLFIQGHVNQAEESFKKACDKSIAIDYSIGRAYATLELASIELRQGKMKDAHDLVNFSLQLFNQISYTEGIIDGQCFIGKLQYNNGDFSASITTFKKAQELAFQIKSTRDIILCSNNIAAIMINQDRHLDAQKIYQESLEIALKSDDGKYFIPTIYNNLANIADKIGNLREAEILYLQGLPYARELKRLDSEALLSHNLAELYCDRGEFAKAKTTVLKALELHKQMHDSVGLPNENSLMAKIYRHEGKLKEAELYYTRALESFEQFSLFNDLYLETIIEYVELLESSNNQKEGFKWLKKANELVKRHQSDTERIEVHLVLARISLNKQVDLSIFLVEELLSDIKDKKLYHELTKAFLILSEAYLYKVRLSGMEYLEKAKNTINMLIELTESQKLVPSYIRAQFLNAILLSSTIEGREKAISVINYAISLAETNGIANLQQFGKNLAESLAMRPLSKDEIIDQLLWNIKAMTHRLMITDELKAFLDETAMITVIQGDYGPKIDCIENIRRNEDIMIKFATFVTVAIGQGGEYHRGLFGPLPVAGYTNKLALVFSTTILDITLVDKRMDQQNFLLVAFVMDHSITHLFSDRQQINTIFEDNLAKINSLEEITEDFLKKLRNELLNICVFTKFSSKE